MGLPKAAFRLVGAGTSVAYPLVLGTPTPEDLGGFDQIPFINESVSPNWERLPDNTLRNSSGKLTDRISKKLHGGEVQCEGRWTGLNQLLSAVFGIEKFRVSTGGGALEYPDYRECGEGTIRSATANSGSANTLVDTSEVFTSALVGDYVRLQAVTSGTGIDTRYDVRQITNAVTQTITVAPNWTTQPVSGTPYAIARRFKHVYEFPKSMHIEPATAVDADAWNSNISFCRYGVFGVDKHLSIWEWQACIVSSLTLTLERNKLYITATLIPFGLDRRISGRNSDPTEWAQHPSTYAITKPIVLSDCTFRLGNFSSITALDSTNNVGINGFSLTIYNPLSGSIVGTGSMPFINEPKRQGIRRCSGQISIPTLPENHDWPYYYNELMGCLLCEGEDISGTGEPTQFNIYLRGLYLTKPNIPTTGQKFSETLQFECHQPTINPDGMPDRWASLEQSEVMIETYDSYPFNNYMAQHYDT